MIVRPKSSNCKWQCLVCGAVRVTDGSIRQVCAGWTAAVAHRVRPMARVLTDADWDAALREAELMDEYEIGGPSWRR